MKLCISDVFGGGAYITLCWKSCLKVLESFHAVTLLPIGCENLLLSEMASFFDETSVLAQFSDGGSDVDISDEGIDYSSDEESAPIQ